MTPGPTQPARNIELKARYPDLARARVLCAELGAVESELLIQTDTYYRVSNGRLKLRLIEPGQAELIWYERANRIDSRSSDYVLVKVDNPAGIGAALSGALGVLVEVRKRRTLLLWQNVRIHLDQVEDLGHFIEFEAVLRPGDSQQAGHDRIHQLCKWLSIQQQDWVAESYSDLLIARR
jgi:predicted adenylyl cyclase CyaB